MVEFSSLENSSSPSSGLPAELGEQTFEAFVFDWDGTAVPDRAADATLVRARVEELCAAGVHVFVISGTHVGNVDGQLVARPAGPGHLCLCLNRGSEVFAVTAKGATLVWLRTATGGEERALDRAAELTVERLAWPRWWPSRPTPREQPGWPSLGSRAT